MVVSGTACGVKVQACDVKVVVSGVVVSGVVLCDVAGVVQVSGTA